MWEHISMKNFSFKNKSILYILIMFCLGSMMYYIYLNQNFFNQTKSNPKKIGFVVHT